MLKTKHMLSALCMLVAMTMATSAFAQGVFSVSSSIEPRARLNGQTEAAGGITFSLESGALDGDSEGSVSITYVGTAITNAVGTAANAAAGMPVIVIDICETAGATGATGNTVISGSTITITTDGIECAATANDSIDVSGVRLAIAGQLLSSVAANITSSGDVRLGSGANELTVINGIVDELVDGGVTADTVTLVRHTAKPAPRAKDDGTYFKLLIEENAADSFAAAQLNLEFSGLGSGMSVEIDAWVATKEDLGDLKVVNFVTNGVASPVDNAMDDMGTEFDETVMNVLMNSQLALGGGADADTLSQTLTATDNEAVVLTGLGNAFTSKLVGDATTLPDTMDINPVTDIMGGSLDPNKVDVVVVRGKITITGAVDLPLDDLEIAATVTVGPVGPPSYSRTHTGERPIPRFAPDTTAPVTVIEVTSDQTTLVAPYALSDGRFDTGFAISNMNTVDEQAGTIMFMLYHDGMEAIKYETAAASPGTGLTSGVLEAGATYVVLLSEILESAVDYIAPENGFRGYAKIVTDFTGADGVAYISDWAAFTATAVLEEE